MGQDKSHSRTQEPTYQDWIQKGATETHQPLVDVNTPSLEETVHMPTDTPPAQLTAPPPVDSTPESQELTNQRPSRERRPPTRFADFLIGQLASTNQSAVHTIKINALQLQPAVGSQHSSKHISRIQPMAMTNRQTNLIKETTRMTYTEIYTRSKWLCDICEESTIELTPKQLAKHVWSHLAI